MANLIFGRTGNLTGCRTGRSDCVNGLDGLAFEGDDENLLRNRNGSWRGDDVVTKREGASKMLSNVGFEICLIRVSFKLFNVELRSVFEII
ncbi:hypothetical protein MA16_Dca018784 [Dendrobium catenatum]|uniref:Uncharacterized protein n=1 Tax=Dendrobium catenatum TaxID=906689 RepID=A0A2I0WVW7_9ASPA|nr:hypothetical protein MA16_Dca018784 [Dendrobium catenatum]